MNIKMPPDVNLLNPFVNIKHTLNTGEKLPKFTFLNVYFLRNGSKCFS